MNLNTYQPVFDALDQRSKTAIENGFHKAPAPSADTLVDFVNSLSDADFQKLVDLQAVATACILKSLGRI